MAEYIDIKQLWNCETCFHHQNGKCSPSVWCDHGESYRPAYDKLKKANVVEVVHGLWEWREEWETHPETHSCDLISCGWYCTECGIELGDYLTEKIGQHIILDDDFRKPKLTRCPKCGARMDGE